MANTAHVPLQNGSHDAKTPQTSSESVTLAFGAGAAWDDSELINAYDAAMSEFHAHHPGPGSWLDKATAALSAGQPLPGTSRHGSLWCHTQEDRKAANPPDRDGAVVVQQVNPYTAHATRNSARRPSPTYEPPSPPATRPEVIAQDSIQSDIPPEPTFDEAISYAMQAQYMAGYWMGVAQGKRQLGPASEPPPAHPANIFTTKRQFGTATKGIKR